MNGKDLLFTTDHIPDQDRNMISLIFSNVIVRDHIAIEMLKALAPRNMVIEDAKLDVLTKEAYRYADALIKESNKDIPFINEN